MSASKIAFVNGTWRQAIRLSAIQLELLVVEVCLEVRNYRLSCGPSSLLRGKQNSHGISTSQLLIP